MHDVSSSGRAEPGSAHREVNLDVTKQEHNTKAQTNLSIDSGKDLFDPESAHFDSTKVFKPGQPVICHTHEGDTTCNSYKNKGLKAIKSILGGINGNLSPRPLTHCACEGNICKE